MSIKLVVLTVFLCLLVSVETRLRYKYRKRPECRENWPRRPEDLPAYVVTGVVENIHPPTPGSPHYTASVYVKWVLKGDPKVEGTRINIDGFLPGDNCSPDIKKGDSLILQIEPSAAGLFHISGTIFKPNLNNLDRIQAVIADRPFRRRPDIVDQPCEAQYCPHNGDCIEETEGGVIKARCICPSSCTMIFEPVCGSDGRTYSNECNLRSDTCRLRQNVFVRHAGGCDRN